FLQREGQMYTISLASRHIPAFLFLFCPHIVKSTDVGPGIDLFSTPHDPLVPFRNRFIASVFVIEVIMFLIDIRQLHSLPDFQSSTQWFQLPSDQLKKGCFTRTVGSYDPYDTSWW